MKTHEKSDIMSVFDYKKTRNRADISTTDEIHQASDEQEMETRYAAELFEGLKRRFTVQADPKHYHELLTINGNDLLQMKIEFKNEFKEFFEQGFINLEKTYRLRVH